MRKVLFIGFLLIQSALLAQPGQFDYVQTDQVFSGISGSNANLVLYGAGAGSILLPDYAGVGDRILQVDATGLVSATASFLPDDLVYKTGPITANRIPRWDNDSTLEQTSIQINGTGISSSSGTLDLSSGGSILFTGSDHFAPSLDNTYDIGTTALGGLRWRYGYFGTDVIVRDTPVVDLIKKHAISTLPDNLAYVTGTPIANRLATWSNDSTLQNTNFEASGNDISSVTGNLVLQRQGSDHLILASNQTIFSNLLRPSGDNIIDFGQSTNSLRNGYFGTEVFLRDSTMGDIILRRINDNVEPLPNDLVYRESGNIFNNKLAVWNISGGDTTIRSENTSTYAPTGTLSISGNGIFRGVGAENQPTFSFNSDINTGIYSVVNEEVGFSANGNRVGGFNESGLYTDTLSSINGELFLKADSISVTGTGYLKIPSGTTAQAPGTPEDAMIRYYTDSSAFYARENGEWKRMITGSSSNPITEGRVPFGAADGSLITDAALQYSSALGALRTNLLLPSVGNIISLFSGTGANSGLRAYSTTNGTFPGDVNIQAAGSTGSIILYSGNPPTINATMDAAGNWDFNNNELEDVNRIEVGTVSSRLTNQNLNLAPNGTGNTNISNGALHFAGIEVISSSRDITAVNINADKVSIGDKSTITISSGSVTITTGYHLVGTEGGSASDDLDNITGGITGQTLVLSNAVGTEVVSLTENGNIDLEGDATPYALTGTKGTIMLIYDGSTWNEVSRSSN